MKLYAFSDFHLSGDPPTKPMDIFGENWKNHREKILSAWKETITAGDTVIMAGDISWATHLEDALSDTPRPQNHRPWQSRLLVEHRIKNETNDRQCF